MGRFGHKAWFKGELGSGRIMVGLDHVRNLFQP